MKFREKAQPLPAFTRCAVKDCSQSARVSALHRGMIVNFCPGHFNAYGRGELEPIEEEAK